MLVYILWKEEDDGDASSHIIGVYKDKERARKRYNIYMKNLLKDNKDIPEMKIEEPEDELARFNVYYASKDLNCSTINVKKNTKHIYLLRIQAESGGGDYDSEVRLYVDDNKYSLYAEVETTIDVEHNREDECEECQEEEGRCEEVCLKELEKNGTSFITCTDNEGSSFAICKLEIKI